MKPSRLALLLICLASPHVLGAAPVAPPTLAQALTKLGPPATGVALTVDADKVSLSPGPETPGEATTVPGVAAVYGLITQDFGGVTAIAPPSMTVLNEDPADPNPYRDMERREILTLLSASLTDDQWKAMTGKDGLALADLNTDEQRQMLAALFPDPRLRVSPFGVGLLTPADIAEADAARRSGKPFFPPGLRDVTGDLPRARLRLGQKLEFMLPTAQAEHGGYVGIGGTGDPGARPSYAVFPGSEAYSFGAADPNAQDTFYGVRAVEHAPNTLKASDLDFDGRGLKVLVPLAGLKTVGDLVARVGSRTRTEFYADRRLENHPLTVLGAAQSAPAADLLRALALCLAGTYRKVGPAYVLTENLTGSGAIHQRWADLQTRVEDQKQAILMDVAKTLTARHFPRDLHGLGDPTDLTDDQLARALKPGGVFEGDAKYPMGTVFLPLSQLTPGQQQAVRRMAAQMNEPDKVNPGLNTTHADLSHPVQLTVTPTWQLVLPSLDGPVTLADEISVTNPFEDNYRPAAAPAPVTAPQPPPVPKPPAPKPPALAAMFARVPRRAVLAQPRTVQDVDSLIASMRTLGSNQLWLVTFAQGRNSPDLLAEALRAAHGTGIGVFAVLDLLTWGDKTPEAQRDRNIFGESSALANRHMKETDPSYRPSAEGYGGELPPPDQIVADPTSPAVQRTLATLVKTLAARPGLAGLVWRGDEPPGYDPLADINGRDTDRRLGYADGLRLSFIRRTHTDPLDVSPNHFALGIDHFLWPGQDTSQDFGLTEQWRKFRSDANHALLGSLYAAVRAVAPTTPILVRQRHQSETGQGWYGTWDDPRLPLPTYHSPEDGPPSGEASARPADRAVQAKTQSRAALELVRWGPDWPAADLAQEVRDEVTGRGWDGFVLDFTQDAPGPTADPLTKLARGLH